MDEHDLIPVSDMDIIFQEIEQNSSVKFDEEQKDAIIQSMLESNRETIRSGSERDMRLILLTRVLESKELADMMVGSSSSLSEDMEQTAEMLKHQINSI